MEFSETAIERVVEQVQRSAPGVTQVDDDAGTLGRVDARLAHGVLQRLGSLCSLVRIFLWPHMTTI